MQKDGVMVNLRRIRLDLPFSKPPGRIPLFSSDKSLCRYEIAQGHPMDGVALAISMMMQGMKYA